MTHAALMDLPLIRIKDIQQAFGMSYDAAARFIRSVKAHSDVLGIRGCIAHQDYVKYITREVAR
jgi:hypothetical protein